MDDVNILAKGDVSVGENTCVCLCNIVVVKRTNTINFSTGKQIINPNLGIMQDKFNQNLQNH